MSNDNPKDVPCRIEDGTIFQPRLLGWAQVGSELQVICIVYLPQANEIQMISFFCLHEQRTFT